MISGIVVCCCLSLWSIDDTKVKIDKKCQLKLLWQSWRILQNKVIAKDFTVNGAKKWQQTYMKRPTLDKNNGNKNIWNVFLIKFCRIIIALLYYGAKKVKIFQFLAPLIIMQKRTHIHLSFALSASLCTKRQNYLYLYLYELQSQNPFRFNCQSVKIIKFYFVFESN